jgi:hypothetical protein
VSAFVQLLRDKDMFERCRAVNLCIKSHDFGCLPAPGQARRAARERRSAEGCVYQRRPDG